MVDFKVYCEVRLGSNLSGEGSWFKIDIQNDDNAIKNRTEVFNNEQGDLELCGQQLIQNNTFTFQQIDVKVFQERPLEI